MNMFGCETEAGTMSKLNVEEEEGQTKGRQFITGHFSVLICHWQSAEDRGR